MKVTSGYFIVYNAVSDLLRADDVVEIADPHFSTVALQTGPKLAEFMSVRVSSPLPLTVNGKRLGLFDTFFVLSFIRSYGQQTPAKL